MLISVFNIAINKSNNKLNEYIGAQNDKLNFVNDNQREALICLNNVYKTYYLDLIYP